MEVSMNYVGTGRRFFAHVIDVLILVVIAFIARLLFLGFTSQLTDLIIAYAIPFVYYVAFWTWRGQTPGKMMLGVRIVKSNGNPIGLGRALLRAIGYWVNALTLLIGFLMIAWDSKKQGLHDKIAGTVVIRTR